RLGEANTRKDRLEAELARRIPEMNIERRIRVADRRAVASQVTEDVALVEFVRFRAYEFKAVRQRDERPWKAWRYLAFLLPGASPDAVQMIDLGEAGPIDDLIAAFRASITGTEGRKATVEPDHAPCP